MAALERSLEDVLEAVEVDKELRPAERETVIRFARDEDKAHISTEEAGLARRLLSHPAAENRRVTVVDGRARPRFPLDEWEGRTIVGAAIRLPIGALGIRTTPRKNWQHAEIVSERVFDAVARGEEGK